VLLPLRQHIREQATAGSVELTLLSSVQQHETATEFYIGTVHAAFTKSRPLSLHVEDTLQYIYLIYKNLSQSYVYLKRFKAMSSCP
jgi:hypothetical protein